MIHERSLRHFTAAERQVEMSASTDSAERSVWLRALGEAQRETIEECAAVAERCGVPAVAAAIRELKNEPD